MADGRNLVALRYGYDDDGTRGSSAGSLETETLAAILGRATCRRYRPDQVPDDLLRTLFASAQSAPSKSDLQQYSIVQVTRPEARRAIADLVPSMPWVAAAPTFLVFCPDLYRSRRITELRGYRYGNDSLDSFANATADAALAMAFFITAAEAVGLGCCPISVIRNHIEAVSDLLGLPDGVYPLAGLCVGHPETPGHVSMRLPWRVWNVFPKRASVYPT